ncbi:PLP-dependent transferase [Venturia nashicola]|uniref:PLP-dependent transferase n=1 Tax=Venturia nashicola TaxID=86259 RepID=A0A4Z1PAX1_9PEZI|nr:PLP-dependent transferase [Venturia nashicola]TLD27719.1 PLP-dependent transferase [Venturia nashicola]
MPTSSSTAANAKPLINLLRGWPNPSLLPSQLLRTAADHVLSDRSLAVPGLEYGPDWGDQLLRQSLAESLTHFYSSPNPIDVGRITITGGASQNLACILQTFTDPAYTRNIWFIAPAYMLAFRIFADAGFEKKLRAVPEDAQGLDLPYLRQAIEQSEKEAQAKGNNEPLFKSPKPWSKIYKHVIYCVPTFSNPSSKTMSLTRRQELVKVAREYDALVVTDDVYDQLQWPAGLNKVDGHEFTGMKAVMPRLVDVDKVFAGGTEREGSDGFGNTASNGSFSKICGPGVRTGWVEGTAKLAHGVSQTGSSRSGGAPSHLTATFLANLLSQGELQNHISKSLLPTYHRRYHLLMSAIHEHLVPLECTLPPTARTLGGEGMAGGYFIWLRLPKGVSAKDLVQRAQTEENLVVAGGGLFEVPGDNKSEETSFDNCIRLCFTFEEEDRLSEGVIRLGNVIKMVLKGEAAPVKIGRDGVEDATNAFW